MLLLLSPVKSDLQDVLKNLGVSESGLREHIWDSPVILYLEGPPVAKIIPDLNKDHQSKWLQQRQGGGRLPVFKMLPGSPIFCPTEVCLI